MEMGRVVLGEKEVPEEEIVPPLKEVTRIATEEDLKRVKRNREKEKEAFVICEQKIKSISCR